jgi:regulation of enolase protein 1 (concanavalin A-like superfamily)
LQTVVAECGKVVLRPGNTVQTSVTASLSDDSFISMKDAKVMYSSNNPTVASVDEKGFVTARGVGTASIFAYVTVNSRTVSDSYPLKVMPNLNPASISVNGKNVTGFSPAVKSYSYLLKTGSGIPAVDAAAAGSDVSVDVAQAGGIPGTAVITLTDNITLEKNFYNIHFGTSSVSDEFNSGTLGKQWSWVRENTAHWSLSKKAGSLVITSDKGDIVSTNNNAENILLQSANTDWTIESKIICSRKPSGFSQNAGILAYQDDDNFVKLVYRAGGGRRGMGGFGGFGGPGSAGIQPGSVELVIEKDGYQRSAATLSMADIIKDNNTLVLKLDKKGAIFTASCSSDGKNFKSVGTADIILKDVKAGIITCDGVTPARMGNFPGMQQQQPAQPETPFEVSYDYFHIKNTGLK